MTTRIGFVGPADDLGTLRVATELLLKLAEQVIYLGEDNAAENMVEQWATELRGGADFLARAVEVAAAGTPAEINALLESDRLLRRLAHVRTLPPPPARAIEMIADRIVIFVHDKRILDEEDIANANIIVYGKSSVAMLKRFGPRYFFTPGPLQAGDVAVLETDEDSKIIASAYALDGELKWREALQGKKSRVSVSG